MNRQLLLSFQGPHHPEILSRLGALLDSWPVRLLDLHGLEQDQIFSGLWQLEWTSEQEPQLMEGIQDPCDQQFSEPALLPENCLDDSNRQIFLLPKEMMDFWPSLINEHEPNMEGTDVYSEAISLEQMLEIFDEMKKFMALTLTI